MKKTMLISSLVLGIIFAGINVLCFFFLSERFFIDAIISLCLAVCWFPILKVLIKSSLHGTRLSDLKTAAILGATVFAPFSLGSAVLKVYGSATSVAAAYCGTNAIALAFLLPASAAILYFILAFNPKAFLPHFFDVCSCGIIVKAHKKTHKGKTQITTQTTTTSRERVGEIHSNDYTERYDVYADVKHTATKTETYDNYECDYVCPRCRKSWNKTERV